MTDYNAFDDVEWIGLFVASRKASEAIGKMLREHSLTVTLDPGGAEVRAPDGWYCRISTLDDVADYETLRGALELRKR